MQRTSASAQGVRLALKSILIGRASPYGRKVAVHKLQRVIRRYCAKDMTDMCAIVSNVELLDGNAKREKTNHESLPLAQNHIPGVFRAPGGQRTVGGASILHGLVTVEGMPSSGLLALLWVSGRVVQAQ
ncbi:hypothetical protein L596_011046 [Steinernema carpocapsae]|uniref:Uncharacterized protein n=1 Tax=Steinernema carpocapsae TaxID=34508 RepID=A0A4V6A4C9_STECR|nr:hypothetical protein L596_011046 [Steinernema carpocapsae]